MYLKVITLRFQNAGIFPKSWKKDKDGEMVSRSKDDRVFIGTSRDPRTPDQWINQRIGTFHYSFIENVVRVLCGERPISKYRPTCVVGNETYKDIAKRALIRVDSFAFNTKDGQRYASEKMTTRKCLDNSWASASPSWTRFKYLLPESLYKDLAAVASDICKRDAETMLFDTVSDILSECLLERKDKRVIKLVEEAKMSRCEPLAKLLTGNKMHSLFQAGYRGLGIYFKTLVTKGVCDVIRLDGLINIPISEDELELFRNGNGMATLFDGGFVRIDGICDLSRTNLDLVACGSEAVQT